MSEASEQALPVPLPETGLSAASAAAPAGMDDSAPKTLWGQIEDFIERGGERLNPILVKETRQALKSRQFTITFSLLLLACWGWSIGGVALIGPEIFYQPSGMPMFFGYFIILAFPLTVIVPFSAFRSLITEQEDNTYELLSISTLTPRQIVTGKLGSSLIQMLVYFSAVAPCLAFTYLLRGVDIVALGMFLVYVFFVSLGLSAIGLLVATLSKLKMVHVPLSVILLCGLFGAFCCWFPFLEEVFRYGGSFFSEEEFWPVNLMLGTFFGTTFILVILAAAARLNFPGENGATPIRLAMLFQQCCFLGWMGWIMTAESLDVEMFLFITCICALYWWAMGVFMTSESPELSFRVRRKLPSSTLGRMFFTWFNPGPGTGYAFAVANLTAVIALGFVSFEILIQQGGMSHYTYSYRTSPTFELIKVTMVVALGYVAFYLGLGSLLIGLLRKWWHVPMTAGVLLQAALPFIGIAVPAVIQMMSPTMRNMDYTLLQVTNPFWTIMHIVNPYQSSYNEALKLLVPVSGAGVFLMVVFWQLARELRYVRISAPARVLEEEAELHPAPVPQPQSPWD